MKDYVTKFDLEAAFKALDEIETPKVGKVRSNRPALNEIFSRKSKFDALMEEYYDINDMAELDSAKNAREAEVARAKLARIEKIVDLDAESPEDLLPSYVGKFIMQCPQCMTLFYKDPEDVEASEDDPETVNVSEVCQHCGNDAGYTLIGKVGEATEEEAADVREEQTVDVTSTEEGVEDESEDLGTEMPDEADGGDEDIELDPELDALDLDAEEDEDEDEQTEKAEEGFNVAGGQLLIEELTEDADLEVSAAEFEELIGSPEFKKPISDNEARAMLGEFNSENGEKVVQENATTKNRLTEMQDFLRDSIYDVFSSGKFIYRPVGGTPPTVKKINDSTYCVIHNKGGASVVVVFDMTRPEDSTLNFTVDGKPFTTRSTSDAQDFILAELQVAYSKLFDINLDEEAHELAVAEDDQGTAEPDTLTEGALDKLKDVVDGIASALKSRDAKADWILANAMQDYNNIVVNTDGQLVPDRNNQRFKNFVVVGFTSRDNKGNLIDSAPEFDDKNLVIGKNGIQVKDNYKDADKIAKGWSMVQGNGPAFIYLANGKDDNNAVFLCEYFMGNLANDQLGKYFKIVKDHIKGARLMDQGGMSNEPSGADADNSSYRGRYLRDNLATIMDETDDLQEAILEKFISDSLVESYGNVAGFRLSDCAYNNNKFMVDGTIYFTSGNTRKTTYSFLEACYSKNGKVKLRGLNEKLGLNKQFIIAGYTDKSKAFITESFKIVKK